MTTGWREHLGSVEMFWSEVNVARLHGQDLVEIDRFDKRRRDTVSATMEPATAALLVTILSDIDDWTEFRALVKHLRAATNPSREA